MGGKGAALLGLLNIRPVLIWPSLELLVLEGTFVLLGYASLNMVLLINPCSVVLLLCLSVFDECVFGECEEEFKHNPLSSELVWGNKSLRRLYPTVDGS